MFHFLHHLLHRLERFIMKNFQINCTATEFPAGTVGGSIEVTLTGLNPVVAPVVVLIPDADGIASFPQVLASGDYIVSAQLLESNGGHLGVPVTLSFTVDAPVSLLVPTAITVV